MNIFRYVTDVGKDLILEYINKLPKKQRAEAILIKDKLEQDGVKALEALDIRQLKKNFWR